MTKIKFKRKQVNITLSELQIFKIEKLCEEMNMTMSEWVRHKVNSDYYSLYNTDKILKSND